MLYLKIPNSVIEMDGLHIALYSKLCVQNSAEESSVRYFAPQVLAFELAITSPGSVSQVTSALQDILRLPGVVSEQIRSIYKIDLDSLIPITDFVYVPYWAVRTIVESELRGRMTLLYFFVKVVSTFHKVGEVYCGNYSQQTIARIAGCSTTTASLRLSKCEELGILEIKHNKGDSAENNWYRIPKKFKGRFHYES